MPSVFTDEAGTYDLTITTAADWTVSSGGMPNGDNYVTGDGTIAPTYNLNGDDFHIADGTAWSIELWLYLVSTGTQSLILSNNDAGLTTKAWDLLITSGGIVRLGIANTSGGNYMEADVTVATATWTHVVFVKQTGANLKGYRNNSLVTTVTSTTGTARTPTASYRLYFGTGGDGSNDMVPNHRISKLAIDNAELTTTIINNDYLAMTAS